MKTLLYSKKTTYVIFLKANYFLFLSKNKAHTNNGKNKFKSLNIFYAQVGSTIRFVSDKKKISWDTKNTMVITD